MTDEVLSQGRYAHTIDEWTLIPSKGGVFELEIDGELVYSKKATGRHATVEEILEAFAQRIGG